MDSERLGTQRCWIVGAVHNKMDDQLGRFLSEGIWENGYDEKYTDVVRTMRPGEPIAIKSAYTRKNGLPFDNRGYTVSVMLIKAVGTITENLGDGKRVRVAWRKLEPAREWYFYTNRQTVWRVMPGDWMADGLIAFAFNDRPQDIDRFSNAPFWRERFGKASGNARFEWTAFFEAVATKLLDYQNDRTALIAGISDIASSVQGLGYLQDRFADGSKGLLQDICPFTAMGIFNRSMTDANRSKIAEEFAKFLGVSLPVPQSFLGIPCLNNQRSWFFRYAEKRGPQDIERLWAVFVEALRLADDDDAASVQDFTDAYNAALQVWGVAWNLSTGLYWARPWDFVTLDSPSRHYIKKRLRIEIKGSPDQGPCNGDTYLALIDNLKSRFKQDNFSVHSFPELSLEAESYKDASIDPIDPGPDVILPVDDSENGMDDSILPPVGVPSPYTVDDIIKDGCFLERGEIVVLLTRLQRKKNLVLQGPPGTGKTWLAKRLAFALMGQKDEERLRAVQFHPNLSYEDFVRGWRPTGEGKLSLVDGVFMEAITAAVSEPQAAIVVVIEEINRGNPAQIFGELLTLLESSKRTPSEALELCYPDADGQRRPVHIPENLYVIGTMNVADRSLALVDFALRRRFAFASLEPRLGPVWRDWVVKERNLDPLLVEGIETRIQRLNTTIAEDVRLGKPFRVGHSYVTPAQRLEQGETREWFIQVVATEISPLLEEYWFDSPEKSQKASELLLEAW